MSEPILNQVGTIWIPVRNLEHSVRWYAEKLGLKLAYHWGTGADFLVGEGPMLITLFQKDDMVPLGLIDEATGTPCFGFSTNDIKHTHALLSGRGVEVSGIREYDMVSAFNITDPDGNRIGVGYEKPNSPHYRP